ncbi:MAG: hypothetical protein U0V64_06495 [Cyclobacteriaceae bacterium]
MQKRNNLFAAFAFLMVLGLGACDSNTSINPPADDYFLKYFGHDGNQTGRDLVVNADGTYTLLGTTTSLDSGTQIYLVRADNRGNVIWEKSFGGLHDDEAVDIEPTSNGYVTVNNLKDASGHYYIRISLWSQSGIETNFAEYKVKANYDARASAVTPTSSGFLVAGSTTDVSLKPDGPLGTTDIMDALSLKYDQTLVKDLSYYDALGYSDSDASTRIFESPIPGKFYCFGYTDGFSNASNSSLEFWSAEFDNNGFQNSEHYGTLNDEYLGAAVFASKVEAEVGYIMVGPSENAVGDIDFYIEKLTQDLSPSGLFPGRLMSLSLGKYSSMTQLGHAAAAQTSAGEYLVSGNSVSNPLNGSDIFLWKVGINGIPTWKSPILFGGAGDDTCGNVVELPDGRIVLVGTMSVGKDNQTKMVLIKLNSNGLFK